MTKAFLSFVILSFSVVVFATPAKSEKKLEGSRFVFEALAETFPEFVEDVGDSTKEIKIPQLSCFSANEIVENQATTNTVCEAINNDFKKIRKSATNLFLVLLNQRMTIHNYSSPGITYIELRDVDCKMQHSSKYECTVRQVR
ncbi:hypothetical protein [Bdellovibrio sp. HCB2-146]|uniref:hypothetical protein n=1 Tax=Bdellovibrio sp. HCB2-146 TaxID=3394362 RepID=UPI0039BD6A88